MTHRLIIHTLVVKGIIEEENLINTQVNLRCLNTDISKIGREHHCRLNRFDIKAKDADLSNVVWELFILGTGSMTVDFTYRQLK